MSRQVDINTVGNEWTGPALLLVDLDAFFASVEQLDHPQWRGKPVIVGGMPGRRGVVSTCSYEARAYGVRSAMPSLTAQRLCPDAIWSEAHFDRYHEVSSQVIGIMYDESPLIEQVSIDEAFLDVTPGRFCKEDPAVIAARIAEKVRALGVTCSIGVASGKTVAKIASDLDKPDGLSIVYPGSEQHFLAPMDIRCMPGIGAKSAEKLHARGIRNLGELAQSDIETLRPIFGINAEAMRLRAAGIDPRKIKTDRETKSISHERTFAEDLTEGTEIEAAIDLLCSMVARRLRRKGFSGSTVTLKLRYDDLSIRTAQRRLPLRMNDEAKFIPVAKELLREIWRPGDRVRLVGVGVSGFDECEEQLDLFNSAAQTSDNSDLINAADSVKDRFGEEAVRFGRELKLKAKGTGSSGNNDGGL